MTVVQLSILTGLGLFIVLFLTCERSYQKSERDREFQFYSSDRDIAYYVDPNEHGPYLSMAFLHMRKSGGTHVDTIINEFMLENGCIDKTERVGVRGIREGVPLDMLGKRNYTRPSKCPRVNYIHEEMVGAFPCQTTKHLCIR